MYRFIVLSPTITTNALGRALFLSDMCSHIGPTQVIGVGRGHIWSGSLDFENGVIRLRSSTGALRYLESVSMECMRENVSLIILAVKPFTSSWGLCASAKLGGVEFTFVADADDWDISLSREFAARGPLCRGRLLFRQNHPRRIAHVLSQALPLANILTVSSDSLARMLPDFAGVTLRIPHPRPSVPYRPPTATVRGRLRLGFLGTARAHKGLEMCTAVLRARPSFELHVLEGTTLPSLHGIAERVVWHPHLGPETIYEAFADIDVVVLPQDLSSTAARYQLPAKLLDAFRHGRCVVASPTDAIVEVARGGVFLAEPELDAWLDILDRLAADPGLCVTSGHEALDVFEKCWSSKVLARSFRHALDSAVPRQGPSAPPEGGNCN
jgi:hypothetical protein